ncbi:PREDICTED: leucine-rich repeat-containing protein C10orf11-like [Ceratosolen solmsi marchali]|uniref:Leucine-rich repeat-containing protein C10orf11-like n=1 Tax=Ceratosolen solmsi marchali TaxID=326594 RepID=A0AAJ6YS64_9HYME|nr:PREDICTED: leucine-rich repeat-containing protein C10orf11-like [Ceratosolen solmsi marchali]
MAEKKEQNFNHNGLTISCNRAWYTGQHIHKIPNGLIGVVGIQCIALDLSYNKLKTISAIKDFIYLEELILDNNDLQDLQTLPVIPTLTTLSLNNNKITDIDSALEIIQQCCPRVGYVSLLGNPGCPDQLTNPYENDEDDYERYRLYAIHVLPHTLRFLDSRPVTHNEQIQAKSRGKLLKTVRLDAKTALNIFTLKSSKQFNEADFHVNYTPLPTNIRNPQDHKGAFGKCKYHYSGKNSEGNRFISNNDL